ncbi:ANK1 [Symbiodinium sp. CCMP2592]|nr:ANK1 [Symbiodinium sp. CCMP2592]
MSTSGNASAGPCTSLLPRPILTQPQHALYRTVAKPWFLLGRPAADFEDIPLFSKLMLSGDVESSQEARLWYLRVLRRGLAVKSGAFTAADKLSRQAMARRNVLPWIMSFAGSKELGSLPVFLEAAGCVEAALQAPVVSAEGAALKLSVAEWATAQAARAPQRGNRNHAQQVLRAVGRIVSALLRIPGDDPARSRVLTSSHTQLLAIGRAVQSCAAAWVRLQEPTSVEGAAEEEVPASEAATQVPVALLWEQVCILARLATEKRKAAGNVSDEPEAKRPRNAEDMSLAAQLDSVLWLVAQLEEGFQAVALPRASECLLAVSLRRREPSGSLQELLLITFTFVQVSPLSPLVHELFGQLVRYLLAQGEHGRHNLHVQEEAITSAFQVLMAMSNKDLALSSEAKESLRRLVCTFLSLPHSVDFAGRLHLLANAILLALQPPDSRLQRLLEQLPSPEAALSRGAAKDSGPLLIDLLKEQLFQSTEPPNEKKRRTKDARIGQGPFDVRV